MRLFHRVLERELWKWIAQGWTVAAEDWSPSVGRVFLVEKVNE
jgi:hypothetical protein